MNTSLNNDDSEMSIGRVEAFSDGVFGVAVTLLVLNLVVPQISSANVPPETSRQALIAALLNQWPSYLGYVVSFTTVGAVWIGHHRLLRMMARMDHPFQLLNILSLMIIVVIPFTTSLFVKYLTDPALIGVGTFVYGLNWLVSSVLIMAMWIYVKRAGLLKSDLSPQAMRAANREFSGQGLIFSALGTLLALFSPVLSIVVYTVIAVFAFVSPLVNGLLHLRRSAPKA